MHRFVHVAFAFVLPCLSWAKQTRIIGGDETEEGRYPYAVALTKGKNRFFCGGSLIARDMVLTAAHCIGGPYSVSINRHSLGDNSTGEEIPMLQEIIHPSWSQYTDEFDFGIVILERPTDLEIDVVRLNPSEGVPEDGEWVTTMGWGDTTLDDTTKIVADGLNSVEVQVISNDECRGVSGTDGMYTSDYAKYIFPSMICTLTPGSDACQGDSGGPLIIPGNDASSDVQIGVVSWGIGCARMFPGVYSRVSIAYDWIKETVCNVSSVPPNELCDLPVPTLEPSSALPTVSPTYVPTGDPTPPPSTYKPTSQPSISPSSSNPTTIDLLDTIYPTSSTTTPQSLTGRPPPKKEPVENDPIVTPVKEPDSRNADLEESVEDESSSARKKCFSWAVFGITIWLSMTY